MRYNKKRQQIGVATLIVMIVVSMISSAFFMSGTSMAAEDSEDAAIVTEEVVAEEATIEEATVEEEDAVIEDVEEVATETATEDFVGEEETEQAATEAQAEVQKYDLIYLSVNGTVAHSAQYAEGEQVDLGVGLSAEVQGWSTSVGGGKIDSFTMPASNVVLYPVISQQSQETVSEATLEAQQEEVDVMMAEEVDEDALLDSVEVSEELYAAKYTVEFYYENNGHYEDDPNFTDVRAGEVDTIVQLTAKDKVPVYEGYELDTLTASGRVKGDNSLVLDVYFNETEESFTLTTKDYVGIYDGQWHVGGAEASNPNVKLEYSADGKNWQSEEPQIKNVGEKLVYVRGTLGNQVAEATYRLQVMPRPVIITSGTKEISISDLPEGGLKDGTYTLEGMVEGEEVYIEIEITGVQKEVGSSENTIVYRWKIKNENSKENGTVEGNYVVTLKPGTLTVTPEPLIEVSGQKEWRDCDDKDGVRPEAITVRLHADGKEIDSVKVTAADGWKYSFKDLPKTKDGKEIVYTISEDAVNGYTTEICGYNVINTHITESPKIPITVSKVWDDECNKDNLRPDRITIRIYADGKEVFLVQFGKQNQTTTHEFPKFDASGKEIVYTVSEDAVDGYTSTVSGNVENGFVITNKHTPKQPEKPCTPVTPSTPEKPSTPVTPTATPTVKPAPAPVPAKGFYKTGDSSNVGDHMILALAAGSLAAALLVMGRFNKKIYY